MVSVIVGSALLAVVAIPIVLPVVSDLSSVAVVMARCSLLPPGGIPTDETGTTSTGRLLFLVPAHNEERSVANTVRSILEQSLDTDQYDVAVIADNCSDRTAEVARMAGAYCYERTDPERPGKPRAIAWGLNQVNLNGYDAVVIVDADSVVDPGYGSAILKLRGLPDIAFQGFNGVSNPDQSALTRLAALLSTAYYCFAYVLKIRAGLNAPLTGSGMGVGTAVLREYGWQAFTLGEDVEKYVYLTLRSVKIELINEAGVRSQEEANLRNASTQRQRWRSGRLQVLGRYFSGILTAEELGWRQRLDIVSELIGYGPAVQLGVAAFSAVSAVILLELGPAVILGLLALMSARPISYGLLALSVTEEPIKTLRALTVLPVYILWRAVQEILAILNIPSSEWIRTARH